MSHFWNELWYHCHKSLIGQVRKQLKLYLCVYTLMKRWKNLRNSNLKQEERIYRSLGFFFWWICTSSLPFLGALNLCKAITVHISFLSCSSLVISYELTHSLEHAKGIPLFTNKVYCCVLMAFHAETQKVKILNFSHTFFILTDISHVKCIDCYDCIYIIE